ncbi:TPA: sodium-dependent transporter [Candidatus Micrarchaeota archaeon]|nr:sodium-dependent transporter [Candidatus Micrarchaeota archaeon]
MPPTTQNEIHGIQDHKSKAPHNHHAHWSSHFVFLLAAIGSAVGVGNIWRFPYLAGENGGGTFIAAYLVAVAIIGAPLLLLEFIAGKAFACSALRACEQISKKFSLFYYVNFAMLLIVFSYYIVVTGWTLGYFLLSLFGVFIPFSQFSSTYLSLIFAVIVVLIQFFIARVDIKAGLEKVNLFLPPLLFVSLIVLLSNALSFKNLDKAFAFYTSVDTSVLLNNSDLWIVAISQAIFSLSIGYGIMLTYGSYLRKREELFKSTFAIACADTAVSLIACFVVFAFVFAFGIAPDSGPSLAFESLPLAFQQIPYGGFLMPIFFFLLFAAATTSAVSMSELTICNLEEKFRMDRKRASLILLGLLAILMLPSALSYSPLGLKIDGLSVLGFLDEKIVGHFSPLVVLFFVLYLGHGYKGLEKHVRADLPKQFVAPFLFLVRYLIPLLLLGFFVRQFL